jgi:flagellar hook-associated protein 3 FlgL
MRTSTQYQFDRYSRYVQAAQTRYLDAQQRVATGRRIERPADDPFGTTMVLSMRRLRAGIEQYNANLRAAKDYLGNSEGAIAEGHGLLREAYQLAVRAANSNVDQGARDGMARQVDELQRRLIDIANTRGASGQFVFAGQISDAEPFTRVGTGLVYNGDDNDIVVETGPNETIAVNTRARALFIDAFDRLEALKTNLASGDVSELTGIDIERLQQSMNAFSQARGEIGARMRRVLDTESANQRRTDDLTLRISEVEEIDMAEAVMDYRLAETAYQAALQTAAQGFRLSLMEYLR